MAMAKRTCSIEGCANVLVARGWCAKHWKRWRVHGNPLTVLPPKGSPQINPWTKITIAGQDDCWPWTGCLDRDGYGHFTIKRKNWIAPRWFLSQTVGDLRPDEVTRHTCDNRLCCNPAHLKRGTPADNTRDMISRDRHVHGDDHWTRTDSTKVQGSNNGEAKLDEAAVLEVRRLYATKGFTQKTLAAMYGVTQVTISQIVRRATWKHI